MVSSRDVDIESLFPSNFSIALELVREAIYDDGTVFQRILLGII